LVPSNADVPELEVLFVGGFDEEASPLGAKGLRVAVGHAAVWSETASLLGGETGMLAALRETRKAIVEWDLICEYASLVTAGRPADVVQELADLAGVIDEDVLPKPFEECLHRQIGLEHCRRLEALRIEGGRRRIRSNGIGSAITFET
jgi:hypothetical protein